jgi:hypothetical protein
VKIFLSIAGVLAWLFGAMLLFAPMKFYEPTGMVLTTMSRPDPERLNLPAGGCGCRNTGHIP